MTVLEAAGAGTHQPQAVLVPSIEELTRTFGSTPTSVAEIALGQYVDLDEWPVGEVRTETAGAGRGAVAYINPAARTITIELLAPETIATLAVADAQEVRALEANGRRELHVTAHGTRLVLRVRPDISLQCLTGEG